MTQAPKQKKKKKKYSELTSDEMIEKLFSKKVLKELKKITGKTPEKGE